MPQQKKRWTKKLGGEYEHYRVNFWRLYYISIEPNILA